MFLKERIQKAMKRISILILALITLCACNTGGGNNSHADVSICCPADNSVNGYRTSSGNSSAAAGSMPDEIPITSVKPGTGKSNKKSGSFVGNKKSHVFHKSSCASAKKTKDENKKYFSTRDEALSAGYSPCGSCKP